MKKMIIIGILSMAATLGAGASINTSHAMKSGESAPKTSQSSSEPEITVKTGTNKRGKPTVTVSSQFNGKIAYIVLIKDKTLQISIGNNSTKKTLESFFNHQEYAQILQEVINQTDVSDVEKNPREYIDKAFNKLGKLKETTPPPTEHKEPVSTESTSSTAATEPTTLKVVQLKSNESGQIDIYLFDKDPSNDDDYDYNADAQICTLSFTDTDKKQCTVTFKDGTTKALTLTSAFNSDIFKEELQKLINGSTTTDRNINEYIINALTSSSSTPSTDEDKIRMIMPPPPSDSYKGNPQPVCLFGPQNISNPIFPPIHQPVPQPQPVYPLIPPQDSYLTKNYSHIKLKWKKIDDVSYLLTVSTSNNDCVWDFSFVLQPVLDLNLLLHDVDIIINRAIINRSKADSCFALINSLVDKYRLEFPKQFKSFTFKQDTGSHGYHCIIECKNDKKCIDKNLPFSIYFYDAYFCLDCSLFYDPLNPLNKSFLEGITKYIHPNDPLNTYMDLMGVYTSSIKVKQIVSFLQTFKTTARQYKLKKINSTAYPIKENYFTVIIEKNEVTIEAIGATSDEFQIRFSFYLSKDRTPIFSFLTDLIRTINSLTQIENPKISPTYKGIIKCIAKELAITEPSKTLISFFKTYKIRKTFNDGTNITLLKNEDSAYFPWKITIFTDTQLITVAILNLDNLGFRDPESFFDDLITALPSANLEVNNILKFIKDQKIIPYIFDVNENTKKIIYPIDDFTIECSDEIIRDTSSIKSTLTVFEDSNPFTEIFSINLSHTRHLNSEEEKLHNNGMWLYLFEPFINSIQIKKTFKELSESPLSQIINNEIELFSESIFKYLKSNELKLTVNDIEVTLIKDDEEHPNFKLIISNNNFQYQGDLHIARPLKYFYALIEEFSPKYGPNPIRPTLETFGFLNSSLIEIKQTVGDTKVTLIKHDEDNSKLKLIISTNESKYEKDDLRIENPIEIFYKIIDILSTNKPDALDTVAQLIEESKS